MVTGNKICGGCKAAVIAQYENGDSEYSKRPTKKEMQTEIPANLMVVKADRNYWFQGAGYKYLCDGHLEIERDDYSIDVRSIPVH